MVITKLTGGLGNQMFQYAAGRALSVKHRTELALDLAWFTEVQSTNDTKRKYELDIFDIKAAPIKPSDFLIQPSSKSVKTLVFRMKHWAKPTFKMVEEPTYTFTSALENADSNSFLIGYWQTEKYFKIIEDTIKHDFTPITKLSEGAESLLEKIKAHKSASIHVRRGDYISNSKANSVHGTLARDYYEKAISYIKREHEECQLFLFSDDPDWCEQEFKTVPDLTIIGRKLHFAGWEDLYLMSQCDHNIIANSSFSWWGAWLNANPNKIICAPRQWFNDATLTTEDLLPREWIQL